MGHHNKRIGQLTLQVQHSRHLLLPPSCHHRQLLKGIKKTSNNTFRGGKYYIFYLYYDNYYPLIFKCLSFHKNSRHKYVVWWLCKVDLLAFSFFVNFNDRTHARNTSLGKILVFTRLRQKITCRKAKIVKS